MLMTHVRAPGFVADGQSVLDPEPSIVRSVRRRRA
jgi:hypothetical protein